jgi:hypothetical protein
VKTRYGDSILMVSPYPLFPSSTLGSLTAGSLSEGARVSPSQDRPEANIGFGVVLAMNDDADDNEGGGVLSQSGFQLDLAGRFQLSPARMFPKGKDPAGGQLVTVGLPTCPTGTQPAQVANAPVEQQGKAPEVSPMPKPKWDRKVGITFQTRLGLGANQQLNVAAQEAPEAGGAEGEIVSALEQASQVALTGQFDFVIPVANDRLDFIVSPIFGVNWTRLESFAFPSIRVGDSIASAEPYFNRELVRQTRSRLNRTLPLQETSVMTMLVFKREGQVAFYAGPGLMVKEGVARRIIFDQDSTAEPDNMSLRDSLETPTNTFWRAAFGVRVAGVLDVRVDASGPVAKRDQRPLLRVIIGRAFPIKQ